MDGIAAVTDYLRKLTANMSAKSDAELLRLYAENRDGEAFAQIVQRHGPLVLGVCRRTLGHSPSAEDAFQATFLALARHVGRVHGCLPGWLYRVASRSARKAIPRKRQTISDQADRRDPFADVEWRDVRRLLDEELNHLPAKLRDPLVLCYLQGLTRDEAANQLKCSLRTLHRNLTAGRARLRERLARRGLGAAVLALAVLSPEQLSARVPTELAARAIAISGRDVIVPESVRSLLAKSPALRGIAMKSSIAALALASSVIAILIGRQPVAADPVPKTRTEPPVQVALAPTIRAKPDPFAMEVKKAQDKGIAHLKSLQKKQGDHWNWEEKLNPLQPGGVSCLALLALLENGVKIDDEVIARGLKYIRTIEPTNTYVVALQTQAFCKANQKEDAERIRRNVKWLEDAICWNGGNLEGWSYTANAGGRADGSNSRYAVAALYDAHKAGFKAKNARLWQQIADHYVVAQQKDGGWGYVGVSKPSHTMTFSGALCLTLAISVIDKEDKAMAKTLQNGNDWIATQFKIEQTTSNFYYLDVLAAYGRASEKSDIGSKDKKIDWYRQGAEWLIKNQKENGGWLMATPMDNIEPVSTSFALRFLASRQD